MLFVIRMIMSSFLLKLELKMLNMNAQYRLFLHSKRIFILRE